MEKNTASNIVYYVLVNEQNKSDLANIRPWKNLKIAFDKDQIWIKDFDYVQINALALKSMPFKTVFYEQRGKLFLENSLLPDRNIPSLLWTPIERALPIELPRFNHNFFGIEEKISLNIVPSERETEAVAMLTTLDALRDYVETAADVRLKNLGWCIVNHTQVLILGKPLLPISGEVFWKKNDFLIPSGYDFDLHSLTSALNDVLNPDYTQWVIWDEQGDYFLIQKSDIQTLSIGSVRMSH
jgi:hypothetical protein